MVSMSNEPIQSDRHRFRFSLKKLFLVLFAFSVVGAGWRFLGESADYKTATIVMLFLAAILAVLGPVFVILAHATKPSAEDSPGRRLLRSGLFLVLIPCTLIVAFVLYGGVSLAVPGKVAVDLKSTGDGTLQLEMRKNFRTNYIMEARLYVDGEEDTPLWTQEFDGRNPKPKITIRLHQSLPADAGKMARMIQPGEDFYIVVAYQWDFLSAGSSSDRHHFKLADDGTPEYLGKGW